MISKNRRIKKITKAFIFASLIACVAQAESPQKKKDFTHDFTFGLEGFHYQYSEATDREKHFMHDKGWIYGVNGAYQLTYQDVVFIRPEIRWAYGYTNYWSGNSEIRSYSIPNELFESRLLMGSPFRAAEQLTISPYTGIGYRYKLDDGRNKRTTRNLPLAKRINKTWYLPVGVRFQYDFSEQWNLQGMAEYDWFISGRQLSYRKGRTPYPLVFKQKKGKGFKGELLVGRKFEKLAIAVGPYINYWKVADSSVDYLNVQGRGGQVHRLPRYEPKNVTTEVGLKFNVYF